MGKSASITLSDVTLDRVQTKPGYESKLILQFSVPLGGKLEEVLTFDEWLKSRAYGPGTTQYRAELTRREAATKNGAKAKAPAPKKRAKKDDGEPMADAEFKKLESELKKRHAEDVARIEKRNRSIIAAATQRTVLDLMQGQRMMLSLQPSQMFFDPTTLMLPMPERSDDDDDGVIDAYVG